MAQRFVARSLSIAKLGKLFQIQGSEKAVSRKPTNDPSSQAKSSSTPDADKIGQSDPGTELN